MRQVSQYILLLLRQYQPHCFVPMRALSPLCRRPNSQRLRGKRSPALLPPPPPASNALQVDSLPYLVELDNWGVSSTPGQHVPHSDWTWGRDEITWFSLLNATYAAAAIPHNSTALQH